MTSRMQIASCRIYMSISQSKMGKNVIYIISFNQRGKTGRRLAPVLFSVYMDDILISLSKSRAGCHIGQQFMGAFGYADDVILVAPSKRSLYILLLETCKAFSSKYQVKFNPQKSKLIVFDNG